MRPDKFGKFQLESLQKAVNFQQKMGGTIALWRERTREGVAFFIFVGVVVEGELLTCEKIARMEYRDQCLRRITEGVKEIAKMGGQAIGLEGELKRANVVAAILRNSRS